MGYGRMARSGPLRYATSMPFPGPIPETPWKLLPPQEGLPYFPYMRKGTPSTYGDSPDGGNAPAYDILPLTLTGAAACGLVWLASKYGGLDADGRTYTAAFSTAAGSRVLYDAFGANILQHGFVEGMKRSVTETPQRTASGLMAGLVAPVVVQVAVNKQYRKNRRNRR